MLCRDPSKRPTIKVLLDHPWVRGAIALLDIKDARSDSESANKPNTRNPFIERHNNSEPDHKPVDYIPKPIDPKLDKYNKEYFETIMKQDRGISGWTFSDILGLAVSEISDGAISPTTSEDLNTKSSASTVTSPRSPMANSVNTGSDAASASVPQAALNTDNLQEGKTSDPEEHKKTLKKEHKSPRTPKSRKSELHLKKTKTKSPRREKEDKDENDENKKFDGKKLEKERRKAIELEETIKLLETKIISITSINAALEDQLDQTLAENRKLLQERMLAQRSKTKRPTQRRKTTKK